MLQAPQPPQPSTGAGTGLGASHAVLRPALPAGAVAPRMGHQGCPQRGLLPPHSDPGEAPGTANRQQRGPSKVMWRRTVCRHVGKHRIPREREAQRPVPLLGAPGQRRESTGFPGSEKHKDPFPCWEHPGSGGKNRFPAGGDLPGSEPRKHMGSGVVPGDTQGTTGDAPVSPACNEHSRDQIRSRKVAPDRNRQEPTPHSAGVFWRGKYRLS